MGRPRTEHLGWDSVLGATVVFRSTQNFLYDSGRDALRNSTARWKFLINPNPIVGPDHARKNDNHANPAFAEESHEFRQWLKENVEGQVVLMNGDRHWQYHSIDPETGVEEFGYGPASDEHAVPPSRGEDKRYHRFLRVNGGFMNVAVNPQDPEESPVLGALRRRGQRGQPSRHDVRDPLERFRDAPVRVRGRAQRTPVGWKGGR